MQIFTHIKKKKKAFNVIFEQGFLDPNMTLLDLAFENKEKILDDIRLLLKNARPSNNEEGGTLASEACRQHRASVFLSFCGWLARQSGGKITKPMIQKHGHNKTFSHRRTKTVATHLTNQQISEFFSALALMGNEMYLFAFIQLHGAR